MNFSQVNKKEDHVHLDFSAVVVLQS